MHHHMYTYTCAYARALMSTLMVVFTHMSIYACIRVRINLCRSIRSRRCTRKCVRTRSSIGTRVHVDLYACTYAYVYAYAYACAYVYAYAHVYASVHISVSFYHGGPMAITILTDLAPAGIPELCRTDAPSGACRGDLVSIIILSPHHVLQSTAFRVDRPLG